MEENILISNTVKWIIGIVLAVIFCVVLVTCSHDCQYMPDKTIAPTCTEEGYDSLVCLECGKIKKVNIVDPTGHSYSDPIVVVPPTITEEGQSVAKCTVCGHESVTSIPKLEHTHNYIIELVNPTCTEEGYIKHTCECGDTYNDNPIAKLNHNYSEWVIIKEATEQENGIKEKTCTICNDKVVEVIPTKQQTHTHNYTEETVAPSCVTAGYTVYTCECGDTYKGNDVAALGHTEGVLPSKEPTCIEVGITEGKICLVCKEILVEQTILDMVDHQEITVPAVVATCVTPGLTEGKKCATCDKWFVEQKETQLALHSLVPIIGLPATCTEQGYENRYQCGHCAMIVCAKPIPPLGHSYVNMVCEYCGHVRDENQ